MVDLSLQDTSERKDSLPPSATIKKRYKNPKIKRALTSGIAKTALNYGANYVLKRRNRWKTSGGISNFEIEKVI